MLHDEALGLLLGAVALGAVHGVEPGHGWPVAASYALDQANKWLYGFAASVVLGVGHLISSIAMVLVFFYAKSYFALTEVNEPIHLAGGVALGGPISVVAGLLLVVLGVREYRHGHSHGPDEPHDDRSNHGPDEPHDDRSNHGHTHDHERAGGEGSEGLLTRLNDALSLGGGHARSRDRLDGTSNRGLFGIAWFAFLLGFAHEEEFEIIGLCAGSAYCLELMFAYALTVVVGIVGLTMLLIAGYERYEERVEKYTPYLPAISAAILVVMGVGFVTGLF